MPSEFRKQGGKRSDSFDLLLNTVIPKLPENSHGSPESSEPFSTTIRNGAEPQKRTTSCSMGISDLKTRPKTIFVLKVKIWFVKNFNSLFR